MGCGSSTAAPVANNNNNNNNNGSNGSNMEKKPQNKPEANPDQKQPVEDNKSPSPAPSSPEKKHPQEQQQQQTPSSPEKKQVPSSPEKKKQGLYLFASSPNLPLPDFAPRELCGTDVVIALLCCREQMRLGRLRTVTL
jgi:hypothetical protein